MEEETNENELKNTKCKFCETNKRPTQPITTTNNS